MRSSFTALLVVLLLHAPARMACAAPSADVGLTCVKASEKGNDARDRGALRAARAHFVTCAADACPKTMRVDCARWLDEVDASLPSIVVGAKDAKGADLFDILVRIDGETVENIQAGRPVLLDPGTHIVHFERGKDADREMQDLKVLLRTGERNRPVIAKMGAASATDNGPTLPPPSNDSSSVPTATWVFAGLGVLALGSFGTFAILGSNEKSRLRGVCSPGCTDADVSSLRSDYLVADISLGVGIVALGLATYFLVTSTKKSASASGAFGPQRFARTIWK